MRGKLWILCGDAEAGIAEDESGEIFSVIFATQTRSVRGVAVIEWVRIPGAIGVDGVQFRQVASRGAGGLVKTGEKTNANNFATARNNSVLALA